MFLLIMVCVPLPPKPNNYWLDARCYDFYLVELIFCCKYLVARYFLFFLKYSWGLFWKAAKLLGNSWIFSRLLHFLGGTKATSLVKLVLTSYWDISDGCAEHYSQCLECFKVFLLWLGNLNFPCPMWALGVVLPFVSGSFPSCRHFLQTLKLITSQFQQMTFADLSIMYLSIYHSIYLSNWSISCLPFFPNHFLFLQILAILVLNWETSWQPVSSPQKDCQALFKPHPPHAVDGNHTPGHKMRHS
jgi:hypothetical protein